MKRLSVQTKIALYFAVLCLTTLFLMNDAMSNGTLVHDGDHHGDTHHPKGPELKSLDNILTYCATKESIAKMATEDYRMSLAAKGKIHNHFHKALVETELWINPSNNQWAILFKYKDKDLTCIVGGNNMELFTPEVEGEGI